MARTEYWWVGLVFVAACAHKGPGPEEVLKKRCETDVTYSPNCVELLTGADAPYESRAQVMAAEKERKQNAFDSRLAQLRAQEEERALARHQARTASAALGGFRLPALPTPRIKPVSRPPPAPASPTVVSTTPGGAPKSTTAAPTTAANAKTPTVATPESWLRAARCVLKRWTPKVQAHLTARRKAAPQARGELGSWALALVEAQTLDAELASEVRRRGLSPDLKVCLASVHASALADVQSRLKPPQSGRLAGDGAARQLAELRTYLETYAGLPRAQ